MNNAMIAIALPRMRRSMLFVPLVRGGCSIAHRILRWRRPFVRDGLRSRAVSFDLLAGLTTRDTGTKLGRRGGEGTDSSEMPRARSGGLRLHGGHGRSGLGRDQPTAGRLVHVCAGVAGAWCRGDLHLQLVGFRRADPEL